MMAPSEKRVWTTPLILMGCFTAGVVLSLTPGVPAFIGALFAAVPIMAIAWKLSRSTR